MNDLEFIRDETKKIGNRLEEFISRENITELDAFAFEWTYQEAKLNLLPDEKRGLLYEVRRYQVYEQVYGSLRKVEMTGKHPGLLEIELPKDQIIHYMKAQIRKRKGLKG